MKKLKKVLAVPILVALLAVIAVPSGAAVRMRVTGHRKTQPVIHNYTSRATLLATGHYAEALGVPPPSRQYDDYYGGPVFYGHYPPGGYHGYYGQFGGYAPYGGYISPPPYVWGHSPLDPPLPIPY